MYLSLVNNFSNLPKTGFLQSHISLRDFNANGKAEMGVKIVKILLKKAYNSGEDPQLALLNYMRHPTKNRNKKNKVN